MGGDEPSIGADKVSRTVLQPADVPDVFVRFDEGKLNRADSPRSEAGWKARYRRPGTPETRGPLVIESRVDRFDGRDDAADAFDELRSELEAGAPAVDPPDVGEEAVATRLTQPGVNAVDFVTIAWRDANVVATLTVNGFARRMTTADAAALARKQQRRIAAALGD